MEEDREKVKLGQDESEVEAHRTKANTEGSEAPDEPGRRAADEDPDVEAHRVKP